MVLLYILAPKGLSPANVLPWLAAAGQTCIQLSSAMFLGSLSPLRFRLGRFQILFVVPYVLPLVVLFHPSLWSFWRRARPTGRCFSLFPLLAAMCFAVGMFWGTAKGHRTGLAGVSFSGMLGMPGDLDLLRAGSCTGLTFIECVNLQMAAVLLIFVFRRFSPGVFLSVLGFLAWSLSCPQIFPGSITMPFSVSISSTSSSWARLLRPWACSCWRLKMSSTAIAPHRSANAARAASLKPMPT